MHLGAATLLLSNDCLRTQRMPFSSRAAAPKVYIYDSDNTNNTYILNAQRTNASAAEQYCQDQGGHLVSFTSQGEQVRSVGQAASSMPLLRRALTTSLHAFLNLEG